MKEYLERVEYIYLNPIRRRLVRGVEDRKWTSQHE
jgi:hypothetical protein